MKGDPFHVTVKRDGGMFELDVTEVSVRNVWPVGAAKADHVELCVDRTSKKV